MSKPVDAGEVPTLTCGRDSSPPPQRMPARPEIIAHRGLPHEHPENSLEGFAAALALGVDAIELDVHLTADGVPVVHHDPTLGRPSAGSPLDGRPIAALTLAELRTHRLADGGGVPTLD